MPQIYDNNYFILILINYAINYSESINEFEIFSFQTLYCFSKIAGPYSASLEELPCAAADV